MNLSTKNDPTPGEKGPSTNGLPAVPGVDRSQLTYIVDIGAQSDRYTVLRVKFGAESGNGPKVIDCERELVGLDLKGGELCLVNGPASLPVSMVLAHKLGHLYQAVACFDPKEGAYVVSIAHGANYQPGQVIRAEKDGTPII